METRTRERAGEMAGLAPVLERFRLDGFVQLRNVLDESAVAGFVSQIERELAGDEAGLGDGADRTLKQRVVLSDRTTWPKKGARRVIETAPVCMRSADTEGEGAAQHWEHMRDSLAPTLDAIMGPGGWELPFNKPGSSIRHFYCPIVMPEVEYPHNHPQPTGAAGEVSVHASRHSTVAGGNGQFASRPVLLESWKEEIRSAAFTNEEVDAPSRWQPVSRRRFRGKGWHVDIGPGFSTDAPRTVHGHPYQGLVVLILLSDWLPGGGGTVMVPGSQEWVRQRLEAAGPGGIVHQELNAYCVRQMIEKVRAGNVMIPVSEARPAHAALASSPIVEHSTSGKILLHQICGKAGDVVLMHPWLVHSGTTNLRSTPRLMANGMVRVSKATFEREGSRVLSKHTGCRSEGPVNKRRKVSALR
eukprot:g5401.t1